MSDNSSVDGDQSPQLDLSAAWTTERCHQLGKLERLLRLVSEADNGSSFVRSFKDAEKLSVELSGSLFPHRSFIQFLNDLAIESRRQHRSRTGSLPE